MNDLPIELQYEIIDNMNYIDEDTILSLEDPRAKRYAELRGFKLYIDSVVATDLLYVKYDEDGETYEEDEVTIYHQVLWDDDHDKMLMLYEKFLQYEKDHKLRTIFDINKVSKCYLDTAMWILIDAHDEPTSIRVFKAMSNEVLNFMKTNPYGVSRNIHRER